MPPGGGGRGWQLVVTCACVWWWWCGSQLQANSWSCPGKQDQPGQGRGGQEVMTQGGVKEQTSQKRYIFKSKSPVGGDGEVGKINRSDLFSQSGSPPGVCSDLFVVVLVESLLFLHFTLTVTSRQSNWMPFWRKDKHLIQTSGFTTLQMESRDP